MTTRTPSKLRPRRRHEHDAHGFRRKMVGKVVKRRR